MENPAEKTTVSASSGIILNFLHKVNIPLGSVQGNAFNSLDFGAI